MVIRYAPMGGQRPPPRAPAAPVPAPRWHPPAAVGGVAGRSMAGALFRRLPAMLLAAALPVAAAFAWLQITPPRFEAAATVAIDAGAARSGKSSAADAAMRDARVRLATARPVFERAVTRERLAADPAIQTRSTGSSALLGTVFDLLRGQAGRAPEDRQAAVLRLLGDSITARATGEANLIEIAAVTSDGTTSARLANAVAAAFVEEVILAGAKSVGAESARTTRQGEELRARVREAEAALARFRATATGAGGDPATDLPRVRSQASEAKVRYDQVTRLLASGKQIEAIADLVRSPAIDRLRIQYNEAAAQEATMRTSLGPRHPAYLEAQAQVSEKRRLLLEALRLAAAAAKADWQSAQGQEAALEKRLGAGEGSDPAASADRGRLDELERALELARMAYDRHVRAGSTTEGVGEAARIVTAAIAPSAPAVGNRRQVMTVAIMTGLALALLIGLAAIFRELRRVPRFTPAFHATPDEAVTTGAEPAPMAAGSAGEPAHADVTAAAVRPPQPRPDPPSAAPAAEAPLQKPLPPEPPAPPAPMDAPALAAELAARAGSWALQTILVVADSQADIAAMALDVATSAAERNLRVVLIDAAEANPVLSEVLRHATLTGHVRIHGRRRVLAAFEATPARPIWFVPAERALASQPQIGGRELEGLSGNFDCVILAAPEGRIGAGQAALAAAAQIVAVAGVASVQAADWAAVLALKADQIRVMTLTAGVERAGATRHMRV